MDGDWINREQCRMWGHVRVPEAKDHQQPTEGPLQPGQGEEDKTSCNHRETPIEEGILNKSNLSSHVASSLLDIILP